MFLKKILEFRHFQRTLPMRFATHLAILLQLFAIRPFGWDRGALMNGPGKLLR